MSVLTAADLVTWLRGAGEPSRLRLLALCTDGALSVSELAQALKQSEPRVSRHLKILCQAGLLARVRQGQWVHYRVADDPAAVSFVRGLLAQVDRRDPILIRDRAEARAAAVPECHARAASQSRLGRALTGFAEASGFGSGLGSVLVVGVAHLELLASAAAAARHCTAIAHSRRAAQGARAFAEQRGFSCRVLPGESPGTLSDADLARAGQSFDAVLLDHLAGGEGVVARLLEQARRVVAPAGRLWIFQRYESLESTHLRIVEHPLARLRRLLGAAGLVCEHLSPIEADGEHVLA
ncbi:metalloregulator ArsR/SmtB family transcription factor, partial [Paraburkholderia sp.]|uniref:metalloregulator ArsR/SmtB family transcription factor n=1 Tax=Paraburkholderia sp. TaxID=1926495 RepID=UPI003D6FCCF3